MRKLTRKITLSLVAVMFALIALGTTTYAWFTLGTSASVSAIEGEVKSAEGIEISFDGNNWYNNLNFKGATLKNGNETVSLDNLKLTDVAMKNDITFDKYSGTTMTQAVANTDYLVFDIYIKATSTDTNKKVYIENVKLTSDAIEWNSDVAFAGADGATSVVQGTKYNVFASNAARLTFVQGTEAKGTYENITAQASDSGNNYDGKSASQNGNAYNYADKKGFSGKDTIFNAYDNYQNDGTVDANASTAVNTELFSVSATGAENTKAVKVYLWLNGYDGDCINAIMGGTITVNFDVVLK